MFKKKFLMLIMSLSCPHFLDITLLRLKIKDCYINNNFPCWTKIIIEFKSNKNLIFNTILQNLIVKVGTHRYIFTNRINSFWKFQPFIFQQC